MRRCPYVGSYLCNIFHIRFNNDGIYNEMKGKAKRPRERKTKSKHTAKGRKKKKKKVKRNLYNMFVFLGGIYVMKSKPITVARAIETKPARRTNALRSGHCARKQWVVAYERLKMKRTEKEQKMRQKVTKRTLDKYPMHNRIHFDEQFRIYLSWASYILRHSFILSFLSLTHSASLVVHLLPSLCVLGHVGPCRHW